MSFTAKDVMDLREKTGAGMMACKQALTECAGDLEKSIDYLRAKGLSAAAKKQSRIAAEGMVTSFIKNGKTGVLLEVNCETDFVSKGDDFVNLVQEIAQTTANSNVKTVEELKAQKTSKGLTVTESINELVLKIGEKVDVRRFEKFELSGTGAIGTYIHTGKIGVLLEVKTDKDVSSNAEFNELVKDLCMHIAAADPKFIKETDIDEDYKKREADVYAAQLKEQGKPENMIVNIVKGKLAKMASEVCLLEQKFVKDPDIAIKTLVDNVSKKAGAKIDIVKFKKFTLGEGIEKKQDDFAAEVAKMTQA